MGSQNHSLPVALQLRVRPGCLSPQQVPPDVPTRATRTAALSSRCPQQERESGWVPPACPGRVSAPGAGARLEKPKEPLEPEKHLSRENFGRSAMAVWKNQGILFIARSLRSNPASPRQAGLCVCRGALWMSVLYVPHLLGVPHSPTGSAAGGFQGLPRPGQTAGSGPGPVCLQVPALTPVPSQFLVLPGTQLSCARQAGRDLLESSRSFPPPFSPEPSWPGSGTGSSVPRPRPPPPLSWLAGQPAVLPSSQPLPPQHLRVENAEYCPGLRRELRRRVFRRSW